MRPAIETNELNFIHPDMSTASIRVTRRVTGRVTNYAVITDLPAGIDIGPEVSRTKDPAILEALFEAAVKSLTKMGFKPTTCTLNAKQAVGEWAVAR